MASETESKYPRRPRFEDEEPIVQLGGRATRKAYMDDLAKYKEPTIQSDDKEPIVQLGVNPKDVLVAHEWAKTNITEDIMRNHELRDAAQSAYQEATMKHLRSLSRTSMIAGICLGVVLSAFSLIIYLGATHAHVL